MRVVLQPGVTLLAKRGAYKSKGDHLLRVADVTDVDIVGLGPPVPQIRMWRSDYANASMYNHSEWRHGLSLENVQRVRISGLRITETGGDGIYLEGANKQVRISDVVLDRNYRQGQCPNPNPNPNPNLAHVPRS